MDMIVVALGGDAVLRRGERPEPSCSATGSPKPRRRSPLRQRITRLVVTHGNGPQVGLLALQAAAGRPTSSRTGSTLSALRPRA